MLKAREIMWRRVMDDRSMEQATVRWAAAGAGILRQRAGG